MKNLKSIFTFNGKNFLITLIAISFILLIVKIQIHSGNSSNCLIIQGLF
ncbi:MAG: hypothetical protein R2942_00035 [Ignavibacteria bacterium]